MSFEELRPGKCSSITTDLSWNAFLTSSGEIMSLKLRVSSGSGKSVWHVLGRTSSVRSAITILVLISMRVNGSWIHFNLIFIFTYSIYTQLAQWELPCLSEALFRKPKVMSEHWRRGNAKTNPFLFMKFINKTIITNYCFGHFCGNVLKVVYKFHSLTGNRAAIWDEASRQ